MRQSRLMSLVEELADVAIGCAAAVLTQVLVCPVSVPTTTLAQNLKVGLVFTGVSILGSHPRRRAFEAPSSRGPSPAVL